MKQQYLPAGKIVSTHGLRGDVKILPWADSPEFLLDFDTVYLAGKPYTVEDARVQKTCVLMKLAGVDSVEAAARLRDVVVEIDRDDAELAVALESELETRELMAQIMALPPPDGELFLRRYVYGETAAQLGVHFNMPAATVRTRLHRARLALQKLLKEG